MRKTKISRKIVVFLLIITTMLSFTSVFAAKRVELKIDKKLNASVVAAKSIHPTNGKLLITISEGADKIESIKLYKTEEGHPVGEPIADSEAEFVRDLKKLSNYKIELSNLDLSSEFAYYIVLVTLKSGLSNGTMVKIADNRK